VVGDPLSTHILLEGSTGKIRTSNYAEGSAGFELNPSTGWLSASGILAGPTSVWGNFSVALGLLGVDVAANEVKLGADFMGNPQKIGFFGRTPATRQTVTGSKGGNAALASLVTALHNLGLITDSTS
jgi:hypothetical protein